jgi:hypothetical protein
MKTVTTRRIIRPAAGPDPLRAPVRPSPPGDLTALEPRKTTLWSSWLERFSAFEQATSAPINADLARLRSQPRQADLGEARRLQEQYLNPWIELQHTFDAVAGSDLGEALRADYRAYLELRANVMRGMLKRCLVPNDSSVAQLEAAVEALQRFIEARRTSDR